MKQNAKTMQDETENISAIIKTLWREKIIIVVTVLFFMVVGYSYGFLQPKIYKTEITIRELTTFFQADELDLYLNKKKNETFIKNFNDKFIHNLMSLDTLVKFSENNNKINDLIIQLKKKNISTRDYFYGKLKIVTDKKENSKNKFSLTFSEPLPGEMFLNDYIVFVYQQELTEIKEILFKQISQEIKIYLDNLELANQINLKKPYIMEMKNNINISTNNDLFYQGTEVLSHRIAYLTRLQNEVKDLRLDHDPILQKATPPSLIKKKSYIPFAFFVGLFFSLLIVLTRSKTI